MVSKGDPFSDGDTVLVFVNSLGTVLTSNDDYCWYGSQISYTVPVGTACAQYTLREGIAAL